MKNRARETLERLSKAGLLRAMRTIEGAQGPRVRIEGAEVLLMCSNDYLGLANHPELKQAAIAATKSYGTGGGASRLVSGTMEPHAELEEKIKSFKGAEAAVVFNSGYSANTGVIPSLIGRSGEVFSDRLNHASINDGCILSRAHLTRYSHADIDSLRKSLEASNRDVKLIVTDSVFSMDGDLAPLREIIDLARSHGAMLYVDDAHATGVLGEHGTGSLEHLGINDDSVIEMGTFGKALGSFGAYVAGKSEVIELLVNRARPFIYTTALPPMVCAATIKAIEIVEKEPERRRRLSDNALHLRSLLNEAGLDTLNTETHIIPVLLGTARAASEASLKLFKEGVFVQAIRPPTVPDGTARLRVTVTSEHTADEISFAAEKIIEAACEASA